MFEWSLRASVITEKYHGAPPFGAPTGAAFTRRCGMRGSTLGKEARRRPELDLLVGPIEAASASSDTSSESHEQRLLELPEADDAPTWREDG